MRPPRICLSMIVRNEAAIIARCLRSALPLIDAAVICDTGSEDATPRICAELLTGAGIPHSILAHRWTDFGANRTAALVAAREFLALRGWPFQGTYWLLLDADLELAIAPDFDRRSLREPSYLLRHETGVVSYWTLRLAEASRDWRAIGATHETYVSTPPAAHHRLEALSIEDRGDGGCKADKYERDVRLLSASLSARPGDPRTLFYLAQSYDAMGDGIRALVLYHRRLAAGGSREERWHCHLAMGRLYARGGDTERAVQALSDAHEMDPQRAEPLYELARLARQTGRRHEAAEYAARGLRIPCPSQYILPLWPDVYDHLLDLELALSAAGTARHDEGLAACERVCGRRSVPAAVVQQARSALVGYVAPLQPAQFLRLQPAVPDQYRPCNPSLLRTRDGYLVLARTVNYTQRRLRYASHDDDGVFRTRNVLLELDAEFRVASQRDLVLPDAPLRAAAVQGLEDCRLFEADGRLLALCTTADRHPSGRVHLSLIAIDPDGSVSTHRPLVGPCDDRTQKNWLPFTRSDGTIGAVYGYDPLTLVRIEPRTGQYAVDAIVANPFDGASWRGSAGPVCWHTPAGRRRLLLVHESVAREGPDGVLERVYLHRFLECDDGFAPTRVSAPFVFAHHGVEFACGMLYRREAGDLVIGLGIEDRDAYLCRIDVAVIERLLAAGRRATMPLESVSS